MDLFSHLRAHLAILLKERRTCRELARLSDRELADIGVEREGIPFVARAATRLHELQAATGERARSEPAAVAVDGARVLPLIPHPHPA